MSPERSPFIRARRASIIKNIRYSVWITYLSNLLAERAYAKHDKRTKPIFFCFTIVFLYHRRRERRRRLWLYSFFHPTLLLFLRSHAYIRSSFRDDKSRVYRLGKCFPWQSNGSSSTLVVFFPPSQKSLKRIGGTTPRKGGLGNDYANFIWPGPILHTRKIKTLD